MPPVGYMSNPTHGLTRFKFILPVSDSLEVARPVLLGFGLAVFAAVTWWLVRILLPKLNSCVSDIVGLHDGPTFETIAFLVGSVVLAPLGESYVIVRLVEWLINKSSWRLTSLMVLGAAFVLVHVPFRTCLDFVAPLLVAFGGNVAYIAARLATATRRTTWLEVSALHGSYNMFIIVGVSIPQVDRLPAPLGALFA